MYIRIRAVRYTYLDNALQNYLDNDKYLLINNDRVLGIFLDFYNSEIALYTNMSVCFV